jgi:hypothetical protein
MSSSRFGTRIQRAAHAVQWERSVVPRTLAWSRPASLWILAPVREDDIVGFCVHGRETSADNL